MIYFSSENGESRCGNFWDFLRVLRNIKKSVTQMKKVNCAIDCARTEIIIHIKGRKI